MPTVSELIHSSFRLIGAIAAGETLETEELNDALVSLNQLLFSWNTEGLSLVGRLRMLLPINIGTNMYALGVHPVKIDAASVAISGIDCPLEIVDSSGWETISEKGELAIFIRKLYCDYVHPSSSVYLWPTPRVAGNLELILYQTLEAFVNLNDTVDLPTGYEQALRYNFAIALLPEYPRSQVDPTLAAQAQNYKASIVQLNASNHARTAAPTVTTLAAQGTS
jgi:hypothetical protein